MKYLTPAPVVLLIFFTASVGLFAQDEELGMLPELPYLDLGNPDTKPTWQEKRVRKVNLEAQQRAQAAEDAQLGHTTTQSGSDRRAAAKSRPGRKAPISDKISVRNSLPAGESGVTASGVRLQPFGDDNYWAGLPAVPTEETLVILPPTPDLRTPDQVTRRERTRNLWVAKQDVKKAELDAEREMREIKERTIVNRPPVDPSTALVQVQSQSGSGAPYIGNAEAPETINRGKLKPFDSSSSYYKDNQIVYKGDKTGGTPKERSWGFKKNP